MEKGKKLLQDAEEKVLENSRNYGKRKNADGSVSEYSSSKLKDKLQKDSIEDDVEIAQRLSADPLPFKHGGHVRWQGEM